MKKQELQQLHLRFFQPARIKHTGNEKTAQKRFEKNRESLLFNSRKMINGQLVGQTFVGLSKSKKTKY
jgi:hypothetical protein